MHRYDLEDFSCERNISLQCLFVDLLSVKLISIFLNTSVICLLARASMASNRKKDRLSVNFTFLLGVRNIYCYCLCHYRSNWLEYTEKVNTLNVDIYIPLYHNRLSVRMKLVWTVVAGNIKSNLLCNKYLSITEE